MSKMVTVLDPAAQVIIAAHNRILSYHNAREQAATKQSPNGGVLYHYTTAEGLKGIVENEELWATSAYYLNDSAEILYGYRLLDRALEEWLKQAAPPANSLSRGLAEELRRYFGYDALERNVITPVYLTCFCEEGNLLSQWRAYGNSGGYNIGFRVPEEGIVYGLVPEPRVYTVRCVKVEYNRDKQIRRILEILESVLPILDQQEVTDAARNIRSIDRLSPLGFSQLSRIIQEMLVEESIGFKDAAFEVEKRVAVCRSESRTPKARHRRRRPYEPTDLLSNGTGSTHPFREAHTIQGASASGGGGTETTHRERPMRSCRGSNLGLDGSPILARW